MLLPIQVLDATMTMATSLARQFPTLSGVLDATADNSPIVLPLCYRDMQDLLALLQETMSIDTIPDSRLYSLLRAVGFLGGGPLYMPLLHRLRDRIKDPTFQASWLQ